MPDNIYDLIMSADEPSAAQKAANMAALLRREQTAGQLMQLHPLLRQMGSSIVQTSGQGMNQLAGAGDTRFAGRQRQQMQDDQQMFAAGEGDKDRAARAREGVLNRALARERMKAAAAAGAGRLRLGAQIPAGEAAQVGQYNAALKTLGSLEQERQKKTGAFSGLMQYIPGTDAAQYDDAALSAAQTIGTILEGGKLTDADLPKYLRMLPTAGDSDERAQEKVRRLREMIQNARSSKVAGLSAAGFNTSGFDTPAMTAIPEQPSSEPAAATAPASSGDLVMVIPPGGNTPVPVHRSKLDAAVAAGGRVVGG